MMTPMHKMMYYMSFRNFYYPGSYHHHIQQEPHVIARRVIKWVGDRLRQIDRYRWEAVPITFRTHWKDEQDRMCIRTCILVHDAIEREFSIHIDDRKVLLNSIEEWFGFIMSEHGAV